MTKHQFIWNLYQIRTLYFYGANSFTQSEIVRWIDVRLDNLLFRIMFFESNKEVGSANRFDSGMRWDSKTKCMGL